jgi:hypothetical protein
MSFGPNRDAGCVRRHRNPSTRRKAEYNEIPERYVQDYRHRVNHFIRNHFADIVAGADISIAPPRHGWDCGDKLSFEPCVIVLDQ